MPLDRAGARSFGEIGMPKPLRGFEDILLDRFHEGVGSDQFELLLSANPYDGASDAAPSSVRPNLFAGAGSFTLENRRISHGTYSAQIVAGADDLREATRGVVNDSGARMA